MIGIGNKNDAPKDPKFEMVSASAWAQREKSELPFFLKTSFKTCLTLARELADEHMHSFTKRSSETGLPYEVVRLYELKP